MVGRTLGLLPDFPATWGPTGWALSDRPGRETRQSVAFLGEDLDAVEEVFEGWAGPFKVQVCGPWTLAASVELRSGRKILADVGARRDLHQAYADGLGAHVAEMMKRLPGVGLLVQLDEPALPYVLDGDVPTPSGLTRIAAVDQQVVLGALAAATTAAIRVAAPATAPVTSLVPTADGGPGGSSALVPSHLAGTGVHCCAGSPPLRLLRQLHDHTDAGRPGLDFASVDATLLTPRDDDAVGEAVEAGLALFMGVAAASQPPKAEATSQGVVDGEAARLRGLWRRLGLPVDLLPRVVVTPRCGLAGEQSSQQARAALAVCRAVAREIRDDPGGAA
jgi:hypothetical protein